MSELEDYCRELVRKGEIEIVNAATSAHVASKTPCRQSFIDGFRAGANWQMEREVEGYEEWAKGKRGKV